MIYMSFFRISFRVVKLTLFVSTILAGTVTMIYYTQKRETSYEGKNFKLISI